MFAENVVIGHVYYDGPTSFDQPSWPNIDVYYTLYTILCWPIMHHYAQIILDIISVYRRADKYGPDP